MEGTEKPHTHKYKEITNARHWDTTYVITSLPFSHLDNIKCISSAVQNEQITSNPLSYYIHIMYQQGSESVTMKAGMQEIKGPHPIFVII